MFHKWRTRKAAVILIRALQTKSGPRKTTQQMRVEAAIWEAAGEDRLAELIINEAEYRDEHPACECCDQDATHYDVEGVPLCDDCWSELMADAEFLQEIAPIGDNV